MLLLLSHLLNLLLLLCDILGCLTQFEEVSSSTVKNMRLFKWLQSVHQRQTGRKCIVGEKCPQADRCCT